MGQFSRTDSLPFKDRSSICTLQQIDLVIQIQSIQKGWVLRLTFPVNQGKMFHFWMLKPIISYKSVTCQTEIQSVFLALLASIMQIKPARKWKGHEDKESIATLR